MNGRLTPAPPTLRAFGVWGGRHDRGMMVLARLVFSEDGCDVVVEAYGPLAEIESLACDCGCALEIVGWPEPVDAGDATLVVDAA